jgi:hypothetical protein
VTDANGRYTLAGLDEREYTITAWHAQSREKAQDIAQHVALSDGDAQADFKLTLAPVRSRPATRGARGAG